MKVGDIIEPSEGCVFECIGFVGNDKTIRPPEEAQLGSVAVFRMVADRKFDTRDQS